MVNLSQKISEIYENNCKIVWWFRDFLVPLQCIKNTAGIGHPVQLAEGVV